MTSSSRSGLMENIPSLFVTLSAASLIIYRRVLEARKRLLAPLISINDKPYIHKSSSSSSSSSSSIKDDKQLQINNTRPITTSAPGKVLITGGYQILEKPRQGIVVAGNARFHTTAQWKKINVKSKRPEQCIIIIKSKQFGQISCYTIQSPVNGTLCNVTSIPFYNDGVYTQPPSYNPYIQTTLVYVFTAMIELMRKNYTTQTFDNYNLLIKEYYLEIQLNADNCFYSQQQMFHDSNLPPLSSSYTQLNRFSIPKKISKTGLGSSATLVSSLVGSLMVSVAGYTLPIKNQPSTWISTKKNVHLAHQLAQICHVVAQGKVGSGFDVCSAIYGSICYERYTPVLLKKFLSATNNTIVANDIINLLIESKWDHCSTPFGLPNGMEMILGDIAQGSSTPSMVKKVKKWRQSKDSQILWDELNAINIQIYTTMNTMRDENADYKKYDETLHELFINARHLLKKMGNLAGVGIEPDEQTMLCT
jgi:phosphomevalonate kinase